MPVKNIYELPKAHRNKKAPVKTGVNIQEISNTSIRSQGIPILRTLLAQKKGTPRLC
jgi:hypothetical protein